MELSDTKSQDRYSMTDTVNSEDLNERIQEIIRQHYGQKDMVSEGRKRSFPLMKSSSKKRQITPKKVISSDLEDINDQNSMLKQQKGKKLSLQNHLICLSPNDQKYLSSKKNQDELSNKKANQYSSNNNSLMKYSPSTQAAIYERSDMKDIDYQNTNQYLVENGFSSRKQHYLEASAIHEDQNESDQTIVNHSSSQTKIKTINFGTQQHTQNSPVFSKSINSEAGHYKTFNEEDSQTDIKNLINKLDKQGNRNNNMTQNTSCSFLNGGSATKTTSNKCQLNKEQQIISQFSQQNLSEILPNYLFQNNYQQQSNLPSLLQQQKDYESNQSAHRIAAQTNCIQNLELSQSLLSEAIKKLTIKQLTAIKMMVKPLECVQQITNCIVSLVKDGRRIVESFDVNRSTQKTEPDEDEEIPWKSLQEYFTSPGRLMNELSRIADIIEMNQVSSRSIGQCRETAKNLQDLEIPDNPLLQEQISGLVSYIKAVSVYYDYKMELNRLVLEEQQIQQRINFEKKMLKQQQITQKENIFSYPKNNVQKDSSNNSNFNSKSNKEKIGSQTFATNSRKQSHDKQSNMTFGQSITSDSQRYAKNILQAPKQSSASIANFQSNINQSQNIQNNLSLNSCQQLSTSIVVKTPIKNQTKKNLTPNKQNRRLSGSSSHQDILNNQSAKHNKQTKVDNSQRSLSKSNSHKINLRSSDQLSESSSRSGLNLPKQIEITNTREVKKQLPQQRLNTQNTNTTRSSNRLNTSCSSQNSNMPRKSEFQESMNQTQKLNTKLNSENNKQSSSQFQKQIEEKKFLHKREQSQGSLAQQSTHSTRSRFSTQISEENKTKQTKTTSRSISNKRQGSLLSIKNRKDESQFMNSPMSTKPDHQKQHLNSSQSLSSNRQRSLSQSSRNSSSQRDLKSRNEAAATSKISRLDKILKLKVKKPEANSCVKNIINNFEEFSERGNSIENTQNRNTSKAAKQKLTIQKQIKQEKQDILTLKSKKSKLDFYLEKDHKQRLQETQHLEEKIDNKWKLQERDRLHGFLEDQKRREKQLIKEMNEESIKCFKTVKQIQEWEDHQHQSHQHQQLYINHIYNECQKERSKREEKDMLYFKKQNLIDEKHQKSINSQKSILETSVNYQEDDLKRLNNELKDQQKRKKDLEDTLERTLDVIYNYRKLSCYKQL
ncbi:hypothetical protein TTHERM_00426180 (macronuclear) [Tetrahymena thermophila SB210]|uniref:Uncharacterized protein n=1 Tax=Tetrahymena thermophila (strain SB210) TaxID=312017 RepID=Q23AE1_TETTS|nr:hypothetical protein TTHERM_00426180 [Tetrahymena thermophila SB210]EAR93551.2 hypothetical protein TTHERM_00426180 [Tetrahymena thermophila SB210]|eukprot:XP_001013796.2 hypothetical protein TTHERM_00426180 [Tetrahymena thermophila SB210]